MKKSNIFLLADGHHGEMVTIRQPKYQLDSNVVIISDSSIFGYPGDDTNIYQYDNLLLLLNISDYLCGNR